MTTAEQLKNMTQEMRRLYDEGNGIQEAERVANVLWMARKAALALETGRSLGGFEGSAKREIKDAVAMYEEFKASL